MAVSNTDLGLDATAPDIEHLTGDYVHQWSTSCGRFLAWEREEMLHAEPSVKTKEEHRQCLKWLLRLTRLLHSLAADPEFPDRSLAEELEGRLLQLDSSWRMFYEAMPARQAEKLLAEVFPNER
jgi:hypothetical protein